MGFTRSDDGPLAVLTLDHGELNLFDSDVFDSLEREVAALSAAPPPAVAVEARGRVVSAGVDVHEFEALTPERAGALWARLLVTIQMLETLEGWGVVTSITTREEFRPFALRLANGPTRAHAATKQLTRGTVAEADALVPDVSGALFATRDLREAVASFLREGPGKASFEGR